MSFMMIDGRALSQVILDNLQTQIKKYITADSSLQKPKLVVFTVNPAPQTLQFIQKKMQAGNQIGIDIEVKKYPSAMRFEQFANDVSEMAHMNDVNGVIIQEPIPSDLSTVTIFNYIPDNKEIEGIKPKAPFYHPVGLAVLTALKSVFDPADMTIFDNVMIDPEKDINFFRTVLKRKKIVLLGTGKTGGQPIASTLTKFKLSFINLNSKTQTPEDYLNEADIIISAVGKDVVDVSGLKPTCVMISVGLRKENGLWKGDYNELGLEDSVSAYTPTPGGIGPLTVAYLMHNTFQAWKLQNGL